MFDYIYTAVIDEHPKKGYLERIVRAQLEAEYGFPICNDDFDEDPCEDVAQYMGTTMTMSSPKN